MQAGGRGDAERGARTLGDLRLFWREFRRSFHTTGAVAPSGRALAEALARSACQLDSPRKVLEVGPGTGVVTRRLAERWRTGDRLDLVEINPAFAELLEAKLAAHRDYEPLRPGARVICAAIEEARLDAPYDAVISGLPLNNFSADTVERILRILTGALRPGGTLSFFEYAGIRQAKTLVSRGDERRRLQGVGRALSTLLPAHSSQRETVWLNVPPAWVHRVVIGS